MAGLVKKNDSPCNNKKTPKVKFEEIEIRGFGAKLWGR